MDDAPLFESARLLARPLGLGDTPALAAILGDPEVMRFSVRGVQDEAATRRFIESCQASYREHGIGPWALVEKASGELVGFCGVGPDRVNGQDENNLGYRLARRFWGRGYATEAVRATLAYAFGHQALPAVIAIIVPSHTASLRVAEKAGFHDFEAARFHGQEVRLYRLTAAEWRER